MKCRVLVLCLLALSGAGCVVLDLLLFPVRLLFSALGSVVDTVAVVEPLEGPAPAVAQRDDGRWEVGPVEPGSRFRVSLEAPGMRSAVWEWPGDFAGRSPSAVGEIDVTCRLAPVPR